MDIGSFNVDAFEVLMWSGLKDHKASKGHRYAKGVSRAIILSKGVIHCFENDKWTTEKGAIWDILKDFQSRSKKALYGYFGYDLKNEIESLTSNNQDYINAPDLYWVEPIEEIKWSVGQPVPDERVNSIINSEDNLDIEFDTLSNGVDQNEYEKNIQVIKDAIFEGEFYELNYTRQKKFKLNNGNIKAVYSAMLKYAPVPFSCYMNTGIGIELASMSPERFLRHTKGELLSEPIKGTRRKSWLTINDVQQIKQELKASTKDRAENLMIVDLVRNDLNQVSIAGTEKADNLFDIQDFGTVIHMVSSVKSMLDTNRHPFDAIKHAFPMGSMTGTPKIRVMEWIEKLENYKRGIYSGSIGYIEPNLDFDLNVVIRTVISNGEYMFYSTGGAITSDSVPHEEWEETCVKCTAFESAINHKELF